ncbi:leucine-rich repeat protein [Maribellus maritimus]|uniref:leucine-rich repeat protein n=1 Tax=Maribellus maritimus TaxID=2870838 RepID=UPI001EEBF31B|nr:leucine-rich repeat protein [Maribellus maritimus]MCG6191138.1 leucine-rich repeat protein [Maribellus maritimus]
MKRIIIFSLCVLFSSILQAQIAKTIIVQTAGNLSTLLTNDEKSSVTSLTVTGNINARDFKTMRDDMPELKELDLSGVNILAYSGSEGTSYNTDVYYENEIPEAALDGSSNLTSLVLPNSITSIGKDAINGCSGLTSISIPGSVRSIGDWAFEFCSGLTGITIPNSVINMGEGAFSNCEGLLSVKLSNSLISIGRKAFDSCYGLTSVDIPGSVTTIKYGAFRYCENLNTVTIPASVATIEEAFSGCEKLEAVYVYSQLPPALDSPYSFSENTTASGTLYVLPGLKSNYQETEYWSEFANIEEMSEFYFSEGDSVTINSSAQTLKIEVSANIAWSASSNTDWMIVTTNTAENYIQCEVTENTADDGRLGQITVSAEGVEPQVIKVAQTGQKELTIAVNTAGTLSSLLTTAQKNKVAKFTVTGNIDARDFKTMRDEMAGLTEVDLSEATIMAYNGTEGTGVSMSNYPSNVIPERAFYNKNTLLSLLLPKSVTTIDAYALQACTSLVSLSIPGSVVTINEGAFEGCGNLTSLYAYPTQPANLENYTFSGVNISSCTLFVPFGSMSLYEEALQWKEFVYMQEMPGFTLSADTIRFEKSGQKQVELETNTAWYVGTGDSWLTFSPSGGNNNTQLTINAQANSGTEPRTGKIKVSSADDAVSKVITVIQAGKITELTIQVDVAGTLASLLADFPIDDLVKLTIIGNIDARDFVVLPQFLKEVDLRRANIVEYNGTEGTYSAIENYPANELPPLAFNTCYEITNVILPFNLVSIGDAAFAERLWLTSVTLSPSVTTIGRSAFQGCQNLSSINIPSTVTSIGMGAFEGCSGLRSIYVHSSEPAVLDSPVFEEVTKSQCTLFVPAEAVQAYQDAIEWDEFSYIDDIGNALGGYEITFTPIDQPVNYDYKEVFANVAWNAWSDVDWLTVTPNIVEGYLHYEVTENTGDTDRIGHVTIIAEGFASHVITVTQLGQQLVTVNVETAGTLGSLLSAGEKETITNLKVTGNIDARDFRIMSQEMSVLILLDLSEATVVAYSGTEGPRPNITEYPADAVPDFAFYSNLVLNKITLPSSVTDIRKNAFYGCRVLTTVTLPQANSLGDGCFYNCESLTTIEIPDSFTSIGQYCFYGSGLTSVTIPSSVESMGNNCFSNCQFLESVNILAQIQKIENSCFGGCTSLNSVSIPSSVTTIGEGAFAQSGLTSVELPSSVTSIGAGCFYRSRLTSVILPSGLALIDTDAFNGCDQLSSIYCYADTPVKLGSSVFAGVDKNTCILTVPSGSQSAYRNADQWKDFFNINEIPYIDLSSNTASIPGNGGSVSIDVVSNISWNVSSSEPWLTVSPESSEGTGTITLTATDNPNSTERTATVEVLSNEVEPQPITVTQQAGAIEETHFAPVWSGNGTDLMNIRVVSAKIDGESLSEGDEIGIFDGDLCVGAGVIREPVSTTYALEIIASADDGSGNGYKMGNSVSFRFWDKENDESYADVTVQFVDSETRQDISAVPFTPGETVSVVLHTDANANVPLADAGKDQTVNENTQVTLDGSGSTDADQSPISYSWLAPEGIALNLNTVAKPVFTAPEVSKDSTFKFVLMVNDGKYDSAPDTVNITVKQVVKAPLVYAGEDFPVSEGTTIRLIGQVDSELADNSLIISWTSEEVFEMRNSNQLIAYAEAPLVDSESILSFILTVDDEINPPVRDTVKVTIVKDNKAPVINPMSFVVREDEPGEFVLSCEDDHDPVYKLTPSVIKKPLHAGNYDFSLGRFSYLPEENYFGEDSLIIQVKDEFGEYSGSGVIHVTVEPVNDIPEAAIVELDANQNNVVEVDFKPSIFDVETPAGDLEVKFATFDNKNPCLFGGELTAQGNNVFQYNNPEPVNDYDYIVYKVSDGEDNSSTDVVRIYNLPTTKSAAVRPPVLVLNDTIDVYFAQAASIELLGVNTQYPFKKLSGEITGEPEKGLISNVGLKNYNGNILTTYQCEYQPLDNEDGVDKIGFSFSDGNGNTAEGTIVVNIIAREVAPSVQPIAAQFVRMNQNAKILLNVDDADSNPEQLAWTIGNTNETDLSTSVVSEDGQTYLLVEPELNYEGTSLLTVRVKDQNNLTDETTFELTVVNDNVPYFISAPELIMQEDQTYIYNIVAIDDDKNDRVYLSIQNTPDWLNFTDGENGTGILSGSVSSGFDFTEEDFNVKVWATDSIIAAPVIQNFNLHVNYFPVFVQIPDTSINAGDEFSYLVKVNDPNVDDKLQIWSDDLPSWLSLTDYGNGNALLSGTPEKGESDRGGKKFNFTLYTQDNEGSPAISHEISVSVNFNTGNQVVGGISENVKVYPNPTDGIVYIKSDKIPERGSYYEIYSLNGQKLAIRKLASQTELVNFSSLSKGTYILKVNIDNKIQCFRVLLTR